MLFDVIRKYHRHPDELRKTLFLKDGPLLLRAQLARLIQPIRGFLSSLRDRRIELHIVGVEKNGGFVNLMSEYASALPNPGDYFLPSTRFLIQEIAGTEMPREYRNRVSFGAKVAVRLGSKHVVILNIPTGEFTAEPEVADLLGFEDSMRVLSRLLSYRYLSALVPLVLINSLVSISRKPSSTILETFATGLLGSAAS